MSDTHLVRLGAIAAIGGALLLLVSTLLHPLGADPNDAPAAFAEYAADRLWIASHLGQFLGMCALGAAFVALAHSLREERCRAWARLGLVGAAACVAVAAALQAVDGYALKAMVDRWAATPAPERPLVFEAAFAVRQIEIGLASLLSLLVGLTVAVYGIVLTQSARYLTWLGRGGVLVALGMIGAGVAQMLAGFSALAMALSMSASGLLLVWLLAVGALLWRHPSA